MEPTSERRFDANFAAQVLLEISHEQSPEKLLQKLVERAMERPHIACAQGWLIEKGDLCATCPRRPECPDQTRCLHLVASKGESILELGKGFGRFDPQTTREPLGVLPIGSVVVSGQERVVPDLDKRPPSPLDPDWMHEEGVRGYNITPICFKGEALGAIISATREILQEQLRPWGRIFADYVGAGIANARAFEEIRVAGQRLEQANQRLERELAERKETEEKLRQSEQRYRRIVDTASEGIWELDEHYATTYVNRRMAEMLGYEPREVVGRDFSEFLFEDDLASLPARIAARRQGLTERYEQKYRQKDGSTVWMHVSATSTFDAEHRFTGSFAMLTDITERKRAEEALRESETRFRTFVDHAADALFIFDFEEGTIVDVNRQACESLGYTRQELIGTTGVAFHLNSEQAQMESVAQRAAAGESVFDTHWHRRKDGTLFPVEAHTRQYWYGGRRFLLKLARDITDRKRAEEEVRNTAAQWQATFDAVQDLVLLLDKDFRILRANHAAAQFLGLPFDKIVGGHCYDLIHGTSTPPAECPLAKMRRSRRHEEVEVLARKGGPWLSVSVDPLFDPSGELTQVVHVARDITERKRAEEALRRSEAYLAEGQRLTHTGSWAWSPGTAERNYWSEEMYRIFGFEPKEVPPALERFLQRIHPDDYDRATKDWEKSLREKADLMADYRTVLPDGTVRDIHILGHPVLDDTGELVEYVGTAMDVTERKRAEDELRKHRENLEDMVRHRTEQLAEAKARAEAANREKSRFLANMSHELRTPLNAVLGFSRLLRRGPDVTPRQQEALDTIVRSGEHLLNLINNVLDMAKIESGSVVLEESEVDLHQLLHEVQSLMGVGATEKGLHFALEHAPDLPRYVALDAGKLRQVLLNLVGNAIKYTDSGGVKLRAGLIRSAECGMRSAECDERAEIRFEVEDSGPGIPQEDCKRIFFPFVQLGSQVSAQAGTGLGLAICKQYVELMGGQIGVASEPGKGSVFYLSIPVSVLPSVAEPEQPKHGRVLGLAEGQPRYRMLIVEDQPENRLLLRRLLEPLGFELREAANGKEAVALFKQWHPDLIWMDIRMPVMDGLEAVRRIRAAKGGAATKIIALTAHALEEEKKPIMAAGCDDLLRKPFREQEILDALARHLRLKFVYQEAPRQESAPEAPGLSLRPEQLDALPVELLRDLRQAVIELDTPRTQALIEQVTERNASLGRALNKLATQLDYKRLLKLLEREHSQPG